MKLLSWFGVTREWCVVGDNSKNNFWVKEKMMCRNGIPLSSGFFLIILRASNEKEADEILEELNK